jgi:hypothetical protein
MIMRRTPYAYFMLILNYQFYFSTKCFNLARLFEVTLAWEPPTEYPSPTRGSRPSMT